MKKTLFTSIIFTFVFAFGAFDAAAQIPRLPNIRTQPTPRATPAPQPAQQQAPAAQRTSPTAAADPNTYPKHFFFTTAAKATSDVLRAKDLVACIFGDNANPSNKDAFKKVVPTIGGQKGRVIDTGTCDVVVLVIKDAEAEKNLRRDNDGFAVYRIVGDDLELMFKPEAGQYVAVGKLELANTDSLNKLETVACGHPELRNSFRPNPNTWKNWANDYNDAERMPNLTTDTYPLRYRCDVWVMNIPNYEAFVKKFGNKHPVFDVSTSDPVLRRRK